jgi:hypothetical protein
MLRVVLLLRGLVPPMTTDNGDRIATYAGNVEPSKDNEWYETRPRAGIEMTADTDREIAERLLVCKVLLKLAMLGETAAALDIQQRIDEAAAALHALQSREADRDTYIKYRLATAEEEFDIIRKQLEAENANLIAREADVRREERERCAVAAYKALRKCGSFIVADVEVPAAIRALSPSQEG